MLWTAKYTHIREPHTLLEYNLGMTEQKWFREQLSPEPLAPLSLTKKLSHQRRGYFFSRICCSIWGRLYCNICHVNLVQQMGKFLYFPFLYRKEHQQSLANPFKVVVVICVPAEVVVLVICVAAPSPPAPLNLLVGKCQDFRWELTKCRSYLEQLLAKNVKARDDWKLTIP